jgi:hypothetical protein
MSTVTKSPSGIWKTINRKVGWPTTSKTFRTQRDAMDWSRRTEDEMVRGVFIQRGETCKAKRENSGDCASFNKFVAN